MASLFFVVTTIATVGYGDINAGTSYEMVFCIVLMMMGVTSFSFASSALASLLNWLDSISSKLKEKQEILEMIKNKYAISPILYEEIR